MSADDYLKGILARQAVDTGPYSPVRAVQSVIQPIIQQWAAGYLSSISPSGSFAKGTANHSGTDIDLFISLTQNTPDSLKEIYNKLLRKMTEAGYQPKAQNVSINVQVNGYSVDLVPARRQDGYSQDHSLFRRRADTWTKTNVATHISRISQSGRTQEIRAIKLWRNQKGLDFPSFYLELTVLDALFNARGSLSQNVWKVFEYLRNSFLAARVMDPANTNNIISDDLTAAEKTTIRNAAVRALAAKDWSEIVV
ncbi:nucleotidyltransferase domain-containing protein [Lichenicoccus roseus]|uniref:Nucleotidyltransferase n=1 Tax=Lichenicoccus roseus TaxID=2683649 RepID=A0A5R9J0S3_9PROT|nr:nucleotidyltransferase [Lichenicoccus roseus]TLU70549.1 nucleotidyltransferase [Lichenicoccus roseus]